MTETIKNLSASGAEFFPPAPARSLDLANSALRRMGASVLPPGLARGYAAAGGAVLGDALWFPPDDFDRPSRLYIIPGLVKTNRVLADINALRGRTIWGQNQLYWFSADIAGGLYMHDVLTLRTLKKYDDFGHALSDCLLVGRL